MKVSLVLRPGSNLVRGGTEILADKTAEHLRTMGTEAEFVTPMTRWLGDVVHFFGGFEAHWGIAEIALARKIPIVWSPIYSTGNTVSQERLRASRKKLTRTYPRLLRKLMERTSRVIALSRRDQELIQAFFGIGPERIRIVPHGVEERFSRGDPLLFRSRFGIEKDFVFHCGMFSPGKNQHALILACKGAGIPLVCLGAVQDPVCFSRCSALQGPEVLLLGPVDHEDPVLPSAYAAARTFCLPSLNEVFPLTALEAAVAGCGLALSNAWDAESIYGKHASYVDPKSVLSIREGVGRAFEAGRLPTEVSTEFLRRYSWPEVTKGVLRVYEEALAEG